MSSNASHIMRRAGAQNIIPQQEDVRRKKPLVIENSMNLYDYCPWKKLQFFQNQTTRPFQPNWYLASILSQN